MFDQKNSSGNGLKWRDNWSNNQKVTWTAFPILAIFSFNSLPYPFAFYISISRSRLITLSFYLSIFQYLEASRCLCLCQPPECGLARHTSNNSKILTIFFLWKTSQEIVSVNRFLDNIGNSNNSKILTRKKNSVENTTNILFCQQRY